MNWEDWFSYDETSRSCLRYKVEVRTGKGGRILVHSVGDEAGSLDFDGYYRGRREGKSYKAHRVVWELHNGKIPSSVPIDHINGIRTDNKITNLRLSSAKTNAENMAKSSRNSSGVVGVVKTSQTNRQGLKYFYWSAYWVEAGKLKQKAFSVLKLGEDAAYALAVDYRAARIDKLNAEGANYTQRHGT